MGEARRRGTYEERKSRAIARKNEEESKKINKVLSGVTPGELTKLITLAMGMGLTPFHKEPGRE
jgi:hypothetical protein